MSIDFLIFSTFKIRCISQILFDTKEKHSQTSKCKYILQEITIKHRSQYWYIRDLRHWISTLRVSHTKRNVNIEGISLSWENCYWKTYDQINESHKILMIHLTPPPQKKRNQKKNSTIFFLCKPIANVWPNGVNAIQHTLYFQVMQTGYYLVLQCNRVMLLNTSI